MSHISLAPLKQVRRINKRRQLFARWASDELVVHLLLRRVSSGEIEQEVEVLGRPNGSLVTSGSSDWNLDLDFDGQHRTGVQFSGFQTSIVQQDVTYSFVTGRCGADVGALSFPRYSESLHRLDGTTSMNGVFVLRAPDGIQLEHEVRIARK